MRKMLILSILFLGSQFLFAGDIANFVNVGFSADSRYFMFAQYGITEESVYSDIYAIDVAGNKYVSNGVGRYKFPLQAHSIDDGSGAFYKSLLASDSIIKKIGIDPLQKGRCLFMNINGDHVNSIEFRDFKTNKTYKVNLSEKVDAKGAGYESSFSLNILVQSAGADAKAYNAGSPEIVRKDIKGYSIKSVFLSPDEKKMVLVIERTEVKNDSVSIRYMVETLAL